MTEQVGQYITGVKVARTCKDCGITFFAGANARFCPACAAERTRRKKLSYYHENKDTDVYRPYIGENVCQSCKFLDDCRQRIFDARFTPYCWPYEMEGGKNWRHEQYRKERE